MSGQIKAALLLKTNNIITGNNTWRYLGAQGGVHQFMVGGYYYTVDLVQGEWRQTA